MFELICPTCQGQTQYVEERDAYECPLCATEYASIELPTDNSQAKPNCLIVELQAEGYEIVDCVMHDVETLVIPSEFKGKPIVAIGDNAFCRKIDNCPKDSVIIPGGVTRIGANAFSYNKRLRTVTFPDTLKTICADAFFGCCNLQAIDFPEGLEAIGHNAFVYCSNLTRLHLPKSLVEMGGNVFWGSGNIEEIEMAEGNPVFKSEGNCLIDKITQSVIIGCKNSVIPNGVLRIGGMAFHNCLDLSRIVIPSSVVDIDDEAFVETNPKEVIVENNRVYHSEANCIIKTASRELVYGCRDGCTPSRVGRIGKNAYSMSKVKSLVLNEGLQEIGFFAFFLSELTTITLPKSLRKIEFDAFRGCQLREIVIPSGVEIVESGIFCDCDKLTTVKCRCKSKPDGWDKQWLDWCNAQVIWGYDGE